MNLSTLARLSSTVRKRYGFAASAILATVLTLAVFSVPSVNILEFRLADFWNDLAPHKRTTPSVAVVGVDEAFLRIHKWPLEKDLYGDLIEYLSAQGAAAIAFDYVFAENLDACGKSDSLFRYEIAANDSIVVLGFAANTLDGERRGEALAPVSRIPARFAVAAGTVPGARSMGSVLPYQELVDCTRHLGFFNMGRPFVDGLTRRAMLLVSEDTLIYPSLALKAAAIAAGATPSWDRHRRILRLGNRRAPVDRSANLYVNFRDTVPVYDLTDVYVSLGTWLRDSTPAIGERQFAGRVVFVGNTALTLGDYGVTPLSRYDPNGRSPNVLVHARTAATILDGTGIRCHDRAGAIAGSAIVVLVILAAFLLLPEQLAFGCAALAILGLLGAGPLLYYRLHFVPVLEPVTLGLLQTALCGLVLFYEKDFDRRVLYGMFKAYVSADVIEDMRRRDIRPQLGGQQVRATAYFTDIEGFSEFSERLSPEQLVAHLNEYFTAMTNVLLECHGTLDKFIGDAIIAFFGAPRPSADHARDACRAAVGMQEALAALRARWAADPRLDPGLRTLRMRIGINTGDLVTGNIGCEMRMNYTMIGDTVNLAARIESACKHYGAYTVVGEATYAEAKDLFLFRLLDRVQVKGRRQPVGIYQLMGRPRDDDRATGALIAAYEKALAAYAAGDFHGAIELFGESRRLERYADRHNPSSAMIERCARLIARPPTAWDGVFRMEGK